MALESQFIAGGFKVFLFFFFEMKIYSHAALFRAICKLYIPVVLLTNFTVFAETSIVPGAIFYFISRINMLVLAVFVVTAP